MPTGPIFREQNPTITTGKSGAEVKDFGGGGMVYANPLDNPNYKPAAPAGPTVGQSRMEGGIQQFYQADGTWKNTGGWGDAGKATEVPPAVGSAPATAGIAAIGGDIAGLTANAGNEAGLLTTHDETQKMIDDRASKLAARRAAEISSINAGFDATKIQTERAQGKETGGANMFLARAGAGFAPSASGQGYMMNLAITQREELGSLEAKRQAAINDANNAYEDKDFELAKMKVEEARTYQKDIQDARNTMFSQNLSIAQEKRAISGDARAQKEFAYRQANDRIDRFITAGAQPSADDLARIAAEAGLQPTELQELFKAAETSRQLVESRNKTADQRALLALLNDVPNTETRTIDGVAYRGLKSAAAGTATERESQRVEDAKAEFLDDVRKGHPLNEILTLYKELSPDYMTSIVKARDQAANKVEFDKNYAAGKWDVIQYKGESRPTVFDAEKYKKALEEWEKTAGMLDWVGNETATYKGTSYEGDKESRPSESDYTVFEGPNVKY